MGKNPLTYKLHKSNCQGLGHMWLNNASSLEGQCRPHQTSQNYLLVKTLGLLEYFDHEHALEIVFTIYELRLLTRVGSTTHHFVVASFRPPKSRLQTFHCDTSMHILSCVPRMYQVEMSHNIASKYMILTHQNA